MHSITAADLGAALQLRRTVLGWSQEDTARRSDVSRQWLIKVESGHPGAELGKLLGVIRTLGLVVTLADRPPSIPGEVDLDEVLAEYDHPSS